MQTLQRLLVGVTGLATAVAGAGALAPTAAVEPPGRGHHTVVIEQSRSFSAEEIRDVLGRSVFAGRSADQHLQYDEAADQLVDVGDTGAVGQRYDVSGLDLTGVRNAVIAPSIDGTDDPSVQKLYIAQTAEAATDEEVVEASLADAPTVAAALAADGHVVRSVRLSQAEPPSPDPSGVAYLSDANRLAIVDGEVDEMPIFDDVNIFGTTLAGVVEKRGVSQPWSDEPVGVGYNPENKHLLVSDDDQKMVFAFTAGSDGVFGTDDDVDVFAFETDGEGNNDPEGVDYDTATNSVWTVDGVNAEVYRFPAGADGRLGTGDDGQPTHFDVARYGAEDPEGLGYDPVRDTIVIVDDGSETIYELGKDGALLNTISTAEAGMEAAAGLAVAPGSQNAGQRNYYVVARGEDNDGNPDENDGMLYEFSVGLGVPANTAPGVNAGPNRSITLPAAASLDGQVSDDGLPNPPARVTTTWSKVSGPGTVTFADSAAVDTSATFTAAGTYTLRLIANDGALSRSDDVVVTVAPAPTPPVVNAGPDQTVALPDDTVSLDGAVVSPGSPGPVTTRWSKVSGPGAVTFASATSPDTTADVKVPGTYVLRLTATNGAGSHADDVVVTVQPADVDVALRASTTSLTVGGEVTVAGALRINGSAAAGEQVDLRVSRDGGPPIALPVDPTGPDGSFALVDRPTVGSRYFVLQEGVEVDTVTVTVRPRLTARLGRTTVLAGAATTVRGSVTPAASGQPVVLQRWNGSAWRSVQRRTTGPAGGYRFTVRHGRSGTFRYRAVAPAHAGRVTAVVPGGTGLRLRVASLAITRVRPRGDELVKVRNTGSVTVSLDGWKLRNARNGRRVTLPGAVLRPGRAVRIHTGRGRNDWNDVFLRRRPMWGPRGKAVLRDVRGSLADRYRY